MTTVTGKEEKATEKTTKKAAVKKPAPKKVATTATKKAAEPVKRPRKAPTKEVVGVVEKSVPIPKDKPKGKYPLDSMGSGESFLVQCAPKNAKRIRLSIMGASRRVTQKTGTEFLVQVRPEEGGVRCWRTTPERPIVLSEETVQPDKNPEDDTQGPAPIAPPTPGDFKLPI